MNNGLGKVLNKVLTRNYSDANSAKKISVDVAAESTVRVKHIMCWHNMGVRIVRPTCGEGTSLGTGVQREQI